MKKLGILSIGLAFLLSGCSAQQTFIDPFRTLIDGTAAAFGGSFGLAIIIITLVIRLILAPFMLKQMKQQQMMKDKMDVIKPELDQIKKRMQAAKDADEKRHIQQEMMLLYKDHNINPLAMGCLPLLIQMPILMAFYYAIRGSKEIASHHFLWFSLGHPDLTLTVIAGVVYLIQARVSQMNMPATTAASMKWMSLLSPIMIVFISWHAPAVLPLYWSAGGLFLIIQTLVANRFIIKKYQPAVAATKDNDN